MGAFLLKRFLYSQQLTNIALRNSTGCRFDVCSAAFSNGPKSMIQVKHISTTRVLQASDLKTKGEMEKAMNDIEDLFSTAKDEMEYAEESHGSVYYHDDHATAKKAVDECLEAYDTFLKELPSDDMRQEVQGKVGMKLKELKMAFDALPMEDH